MRDPATRSSASRESYASLDRARLVSSGSRHAWPISALVLTGDATERRIVELSRECGEKCGNQRFHEIPVVGSDRHLDAAPPQLLGDDRTDGTDLDPLERGSQRSFSPGCRGDLKEPLHLRRAGEGNRIDRAI